MNRKAKWQPPQFDLENGFSDYLIERAANPDRYPAVTLSEKYARACEDRDRWKQRAEALQEALRNLVTFAVTLHERTGNMRAPFQIPAIAAARALLTDPTDRLQQRKGGPR